MLARRLLGSQQREPPDTFACRGFAALGPSQRLWRAGEQVALLARRDQLLLGRGFLAGPSRDLGPGVRDEGPCLARIAEQLAAALQIGCKRATEALLTDSTLLRI